MVLGSPVQEIYNRLDKLLPGMKLLYCLACPKAGSSKPHHPSHPNPRLPPTFSRKAFPLQIGAASLGVQRRKPHSSPLDLFQEVSCSQQVLEHKGLSLACPTHFQRQGTCKVSAQKSQGPARTRHSQAAAPPGQHRTALGSAKTCKLSLMPCCLPCPAARDPREAAQQICHMAP